MAMTLGGMILLAAFLAWKLFSLYMVLAALSEWMETKGIEPPSFDELKIYLRPVIRRWLYQCGLR